MKAQTVLRVVMSLAIVLGSALAAYSNSSAHWASASCWWEGGVEHGSGVVEDTITDAEWHWRTSHWRTSSHHHHTVSHWESHADTAGAEVSSDSHWWSDSVVAHGGQIGRRSASDGSQIG